VDTRRTAGLETGGTSMPGLLVLRDVGGGDMYALTLEQ
jgi:hypothetical protein